MMLVSRVVKMNEQEVRNWIIRGWGNTYIGYENNKIAMGVMMDLDRIADAVGLTDKDKEYAIKLMAGDHFSYDESELALMKFRENLSSEQNSTEMVK